MKSLTGGDYSTLTGGDRSILTGGDRSILTGGHYSNLIGGEGSTLTGGYGSILTGGGDSRFKAPNSVFACRFWDGEYWQLVFTDDRDSNHYWTFNEEFGAWVHATDQSTPRSANS